MDFTIHACDISQSCRSFDLVKQWTYLLFDEFFQQGDIEKEYNLPVSMLCDRSNTNVAAAQPGFIGFVVLPLFQTLSNFIPADYQSEQIDQLKSNKQKWEEYDETNSDKNIYSEAEVNPVMKDVKGAYILEITAQS